MKVQSNSQNISIFSTQFQIVNTKFKIRETTNLSEQWTHKLLPTLNILIPSTFTSGANLGFPVWLTTVVRGGGADLRNGLLFGGNVYYN